MMGKGKEGRQRKHLNTVRKWERIVEEKESREWDGEGEHCGCEARKVKGYYMKSSKYNAKKLVLCC